jgi:hypothetical protein
MPDREALGDTAGGTAPAATVEPATGKDGHTDEGRCLNCGTPLAGEYCHVCGQRAHVHRTLGAFWHDIAHGVLHFDGKLWQTLPLLVWRPGELTRRYIHGERARFVSPIALFLFSVFLMFAAMQSLGSPDFSGQNATVAQQQTELKRELAGWEQKRTEKKAAGQSTVAEDAAITAIRSQIGRTDTAVKTSGAIQFDEGDEAGWLGGLVAKAQKNPELLVYKLQANAYKYSWLLIPISVPFVWLLFVNRRRYRAYGAYDHAVFVTYSLAFMTLLVVVFTTVGDLVNSNDIAVFGITLIPPLHIYRQLRGAYHLSRWSAAWRAFALIWFAAIVLTLFVALLLAMGLFG